MVAPFSQHQSTGWCWTITNAAVPVVPAVVARLILSERLTRFDNRTRDLMCLPVCSLTLSTAIPGSATSHWAQTQLEDPPTALLRLTLPAHVAAVRVVAAQRQRQQHTKLLSSICQLLRQLSNKTAAYEKKPHSTSRRTAEKFAAGHPAQTQLHCWRACQARLQLLQRQPGPPWL